MGAFYRFGGILLFAAAGACAAHHSLIQPVRAKPTFKNFTAPPVAEPVVAESVGTATAPAVDDREPQSSELRTRTFFEPIVEPEETRAVVLMYHTFDRGSADLTVRGWQFDRQIAWMRDNHVEIVTTSELVQFMRGQRRLPAKVAVITIDDGDKSVYRIAWPVLQRHRAHFTLALPTKLMLENRKHRMLRWSQVREMVASGLCEIASHSHEHKSLIYFSDEGAIHQLETSRDILERETGQRPIAYFYPLGSFDDRARNLVEQAGYKAAFMAVGAPVGLGCCNLYSIPRVGIMHRDTVGTLGFYFSPAFMKRMVRVLGEE